MRQNHITVFAIGLAVLLGGAVQAAQLKKIDSTLTYQKWVNGELVEHTPPETKATPNNAGSDASGGVSITGCVNGTPGCTVAASIQGVSVFMLEPEAGEQNGDPVAFCAVWTGEVSASADNDAAADAASGGGGNGFSVTAPNTADASVAGPAFVRVTGGNTYNFGQLDTSAPPGSSDQGTHTRPLVFLIGDQIEIGISTAVAIATPPGGSASADASSRLQLTQEPCPVAVSVPTLSGSGVWLFAGLLLVMLTLFGSRRRRS